MSLPTKNKPVVGSIMSVQRCDRNKGKAMLVKRYDPRSRATVELCLERDYDGTWPGLLWEKPGDPVDCFWFRKLAGVNPPGSSQPHSHHQE